MPVNAVVMQLKIVLSNVMVQPGKVTAAVLRGATQVMTVMTVQVYRMALHL